MIEINLLPPELRPKAKRAGIALPQQKYFLYIIPLAFGILICAHIYLTAVAVSRGSQLSSLGQQWKALEPQRKALEDFNKEYELTSTDAKAIQQLAAQRINWAEKLNKLSLDLPSGVWFTELSLTQKELVLKGSAVSLQKEELSLINKFMGNLKGDKDFFKDFNNLELSSVQRKSVGGYDIVDFVLQGALKSR